MAAGRAGNEECGLAIDNQRNGGTEDDGRRKEEGNRDPSHFPAFKAKPENRTDRRKGRTALFGRKTAATVAAQTDVDFTTEIP